MYSRLSVTTPAGTKTLLTTDELRAAVGVSDGSKDTELALLNDRVSDMIATYCRVARAGVERITLRSEVMLEIFRLDEARSAIRLARYPVTAVASVIEDGTTLDADEYEFDIASGMLYRLDGDDNRSEFGAVRVTVAYTAGWATVPFDLRIAASKLVTVLYYETAQNPNLKRDTVEGIGSQEFWISPSDDPAMPTEVADILKTYVDLGTFA